MALIAFEYSSDFDKKGSLSGLCDAKMIILIIYNCIVHRFNKQIPGQGSLHPA